MKNLGLRVLAILLTFILVLSNNCSYVFAAGGSEEESGETMSWADLQNLIRGAELGEEIVLQNDIICDTNEPLDISSLAEIVLDLNGHTIDRNAQADSSTEVINNSGILTVKDSVGTGRITGGTFTGIWNSGTLILEGGEISENFGYTGGGIYNFYGEVIMNGGAVRDNTSDSHGGGIYSVYGTVTMTGGSISGNYASGGDGGGIYTDGDLVISGGKIEGNIAKNSAGAVRIVSGTTTITGGEITGNTAAGYHGGALYIGDSSVVNLQGGSITGNTAAMQGGGILVNNTGGTFSMQGSPVVSGNQADNAESDVYLRSGTVITFTGALEEGAKIGVACAGKTGVIAINYGKYNLDTDPAVFFKTTDEGYGAVNSVDEFLKPTDEVEIRKGVDYVRREWNGTQVTEETDFVYTYSSLNTGSTYLSDNNYIVDSDVTFDSNITVHGTVNLFLMDGKTLTAKDGIYIEDGSTLYIWGQSGDSGCIQANTEDDKAAIGGKDSVIGGNLVINGGTINASADHNNAAGIGGGNHDSGIRSIIINGGNVTAWSSSSGAAIGKGQQNNVWEEITINGGSVKAYAGDNGAGIGGGEDCGNGRITINGGYVEAYGGDDSAGIGGGEESSQDMPITINGGTVVAKGGSCGAGIGGGSGGDNSDGSGGDITITGGKVTATGGYNAAGIGGGKFGKGGNIRITGGSVHAEGGFDAAGIGGGAISNYKGTKITIDGGTVYAKGGSQGAGIGGAGEKQKGTSDDTGYGGFETITINGGSVIAYGGKDAPGIGNGWAGSSKGVLTINDGQIWAYGSENAAGIGGGAYSNGDKVIINDGLVYAYGGKYGAGIGGGRGFVKTAFGGSMYDVAGKGGNVTINGGSVYAAAGSGANAIGAGADIVSEYGSIYFADGMAVESGIESNSAVVQIKSKRQDGCRSLYAEVFPCEHPDRTCSDSSSTQHIWSACPYCMAGSYAEDHFFDSETHQCSYCTHREYAVNCETLGAENGEVSVELDRSNNETEGYTASGKRFAVYIRGNEDYDTLVTASYLQGDTSCELQPVEFQTEADGRDKYTFEMPEADVTINVEFKSVERTVSFSAGDGSGSMEPVTIIRGNECVLPECTLTPPEGKAFKGWQVEGEPDSTVKFPGDSILINEDTVITAIWQDLPRFRTQSLLLSGRIGVVFFMDLPEIWGVDYSDAEKCYMEFSVSGKDGDAGKAYPDPDHMNPSGEYYGFICYVNSIQMADTVTATFHYNLNGEAKTLEKTYSVKDYLDAVAKGSYPDVLKNICTAIGDYGYYAQQYLSPLRGWTLGEDSDHAPMPEGTVYTEEDLAEALAAVSDKAISVEKDEATGIKSMTYSLVLDSDTGINLFFKKKASYDGEIEAFIGDSTENAAVLQDDGRYLVRITGVNAHELNDTLTVTVSAGGDRVIKISVMSYVRTTLKSSSKSESVKKAVTALYRYYAAAAGYLKAVSGS